MQMFWTVRQFLLIYQKNVDHETKHDVLLVLLEFIDEAFLKFTADSMNYNISMNNNNSMDCNISR